MFRFHRAKQKKWVKQALHEARHARHMRADIAAPEAIAAVQEAEKELMESWRGKASEEEVDRKIDALVERAHEVYPPRPRARIRENVEVFTVAICVAMGFRTYFIQPFKIPTGSMQPTLYGITVDAEATGTWSDRLPFRPIRFLLTGEGYTEVHAKASGRMDAVTDFQQRNHYLRVSGVLHKIHPAMAVHFRPGNHVVKGQLLASGRVKSGDHIFVNKVKYNFTRPKRGDVVVFRTDRIRHSGIQPTDHYIKRLAGLENEDISIRPPYLVADGKPVTEPWPFKRMLEDEAYQGYLLAETNPSPAPVLGRPTDVLRLGPNEFLPLGDNTAASLDGRYFGGVPMESLLGPAFLVYWPFTERWGWVR